ncbi:MAG: hypothetical protein WBW71_07450, partial [Bacteroidota bacterium]
VLACGADGAPVKADPQPLQTTFSDKFGIPQEGQTMVDTEGARSSIAAVSSSHSTAIPHFAQNLSPRASADPQLPHRMDGFTATMLSLRKT